MTPERTGEARGATALNLATIRAKLSGARGAQYWRSLEEIAETKEFRELLEREFPNGAGEWWDGMSRRNFLRLAAASLALAGITACTKQPVHKILPYVKQPEELVPGEPLFYASSMLLGGFATGVLVKSREGHPIKVEGNPDHPASLGGSSIWMQASILGLYDPDRSQAVAHGGDISSWALFLDDLNSAVRDHEGKRGAGLRFLTETVTSPTLAAQFEDLLKRFPEAKWHQYDPLSRDGVREGARLAFGETVEAHYRFDRAAVILSLDSDFLYTHPERLRHARHFTDGRRISRGGGEMNRLYVVESSPTVTGTIADHRLPLGSSDVPALAARLARKLGGQSGAEDQPPSDATSRWLAALAHDFDNHRGRSAVIAGESQPPLAHALAHALNDVLGNTGTTVFYSDPAEARPVNQVESLRELVRDANAGAVDTLLILGGNPVFTAPADVAFGEALKKIRRTIHLGVEFDETAALCTWHIPEAHYLESWSDARSFDGTISLVQPLIEPLYNGRSAHEVLGAMTRQQPIRSDYEIVRDYWHNRMGGADFEERWRRALHDGLMAGTALPAKTVRLNREAIDEALRAAGPITPAVAAPGTGVEICFRPDASVWDGRFANNGWLQECPRPVSKLTWENAALISPALAQRLQLGPGDIVELTSGGHTLRAPVWILPGQAENSITLPLGYGRRRSGRVGAGVGFNAYALRTASSFWTAEDARIARTEDRHHLVATQTHHQVHSADRQVFRSGTLAQFRDDPQFVKQSIESPRNDETLYNTDEYRYDGYKWALSIDLTTCIGCNACLVACEAENNIPVVGKDQVDRNREMFWIRIDTYYEGGLDDPAFHHMPVPCMQCEHAPCELVCPVEATVHDHEGLNVQVYNRCVGTRFCSNNCPYKVRRFNFLRYADYQSPSLKPMYNPEVTVRWRGVMEKCTYCVQRISHARINAEKENRRIRAGEIQTACQQACPAEAIVFGDLNAPDSRVARLKAHPLDYSMLGELNTRPRTTYLAKLQNPNPDLQNTPPLDGHE